MSNIRKQHIPMGRLEELRQLPEADRMAYTLGRLFDDCVVVTYASRAAMLAFCKGSTHALIKEPRTPSMITNPNAQRAMVEVYP